ncbi:MAG: hypothetical protein KF819_05060 [Labilithrix sp.]|nr:hypothetical protein [Labilithrix sp.]
MIRVAAIAIAAAFALCACARHVVVDPEEVAAHDSRGWTIHRYPRVADAGVDR